MNEPDKYDEYAALWPEDFAATMRKAGQREDELCKEVARLQKYHDESFEVLKESEAEIAQLKAQLAGLHGQIMMLEGLCPYSDPFNRETWFGGYKIARHAAAELCAASGSADIKAKLSTTKTEIVHEEHCLADWDTVQPLDCVCCAWVKELLGEAEKRGMEKAITEIEYDSELGYANRERLVTAIRAAMPKAGEVKP